MTCELPFNNQETHCSQHNFLRFVSCSGETLRVSEKTRRSLSFSRSSLSGRSLPSRDIGEVQQTRPLLFPLTPISRSVTQIPFGHLSLALSANSGQRGSVAPIWQLGHRAFGNKAHAKPPHSDPRRPPSRESRDVPARRAQVFSFDLMRVLQCYGWFVLSCIEWSLQQCVRRGLGSPAQVTLKNHLSRSFGKKKQFHFACGALIAGSVAQTPNDLSGIGVTGLAIGTHWERNGKICQKLAIWGQVLCCVTPHVSHLTFHVSRLTPMPHACAPYVLRLTLDVTRLTFHVSHLTCVCAPNLTDLTRHHDSDVRRCLRPEVGRFGSDSSLSRGSQSRRAHTPILLRVSQSPRVRTQASLPLISRG